MKKYLIIGLIFVAMMMATGCVRPYQEEIYVDIKPNETAFVIPLEGANQTNQKQFKSIDYLESKKVAAKRIKIPTRWHSTGRMAGDGNYIPEMIVIKVDRSPVTREWTANPNTGNNNKDDAIRCESSESIEWFQSVTVSASVPEDMTAKFLYNYSGKSLEYVIDNNVRSVAQDFLSGEFAKYPLDIARKKKKEVFDDLKKVCREKFAEKGILIENIGAAGGFNYVDKEIQSAINMKFTAEMKRESAVEERKAAQEFALAAEATKKKKAVDIMELDAQARLKVAEGIATHGFPKSMMVLPEKQFSAIFNIPKAD